jgi:hypothetical protein
LRGPRRERLPIRLMMRGVLRQSSASNHRRALYTVERVVLFGDPLTLSSVDKQIAHNRALVFGEDRRDLWSPDSPKAQAPQGGAWPRAYACLARVAHLGLLIARLGQRMDCRAPFVLTAAFAAAAGFLAGRASAPCPQCTTKRQLRECDECDCRTLRWQLAWRSLRSFRVHGPISLSRCLAPEELLLYGASKLGHLSAVVDGRRVNTIGQVPLLARKHMRYLVEKGNTTTPARGRLSARVKGKWEAVWSEVLVKTLTSHAVRNNAHVCPEDYSYAAVQLYRALRSHSIRGKHVMVAGSISPWLEAIALSRGAASVSTIDYDPPQSASPRLTVLSMADVVAEAGVGTAGGRYDAIFSYSSVEHDGLGRCG